MTKEIFPQWVLVNGQIQRVSDFYYLPPSSRPEAICPLCMHPVIMKLGNKRVHHYAHQVGVICAATQPETALHLNAKFYIYAQLLSGSKLYLEQLCSNSCGNSRIVCWAEGWKNVEIESKIGTFKPDISIVGTNDTINAIEIVVTHHVEDDKEQFFTTRGIYWLEVEASESIYEGENAWKIDQPLPFTVCKPPLTEWICDDCCEQLRKDEELKHRQEKKAEELLRREQRKKEYRQHNNPEVIYAKMVDFYFLSGKKKRIIYFLKKDIRNNNPVGIFVETEEREIIFRQNGEPNEYLLESAFNAVSKDIERRRRVSAFIDERKWSPWVSGHKFVARDITRYPFWYKWDDNINQWVKPALPNIDIPSINPSEIPLLVPETTISIKQEGVCIYCGQVTTDWSFDGAIKTCKCNKCRRGKT